MYLKLLFKKAFGPIISLIGTISTVAAYFAQAYWGDQEPVQFVAWFVIAAVILIATVRLLVWTPYSIWLESQKKLQAIIDKAEDPLRVQKEALSDAASGMLTITKLIHNQWQSADEQAREVLNQEYRKTVTRVNSIADRLLANDEIYRAVQDAMNRCAILVDDSINNTLSRESRHEAHTYVKNLMILINPSEKG